MAGESKDLEVPFYKNEELSPFSKIGKGQFADVYKVFDRKAGVERAVKKFKGEETDENRRKWQREVQHHQ